VWLHDLAERAGHPAGAHHFALWSLGRRAKSNAKSHGKLWKVMGHHMRHMQVDFQRQRPKGRQLHVAALQLEELSQKRWRFQYVMSIGCRRMSFVLGFGARISQTYS